MATAADPAAPGPGGPDAPPDVPWLPRGLGRHVPSPAELRARWRYVVVEEVVDGVALLLSWPWPLADARGRLVWRGGEERAVRDAAVPVEVLRDQLYRPGRLARTPRVGDTFAVEDAPGATGWSDPVLVRDVRALFPGAVLDVSADARAAARLAYQGSMVTVLPRAAVAPELVGEAGAERRRLAAHPLLPARAASAPSPPPPLDPPGVVP